MACELEPMSRTYQYRKVMKPMLERKRRARINKCLDELKDLMVGALQNEGDSIAKLEKADVLELTVTHLKKLRQRGQLALKPLPNLQEKYREGYTHCASEVSRCLASIEGVDVTLGTKLMTHLGVKLTEHEKRAPLTILVPQPGPSPTFSTTSSGYSSASELSPAPSSSSSSSRESPLPTSQHGLLTFASTQPSVPKPSVTPQPQRGVNSVSADLAQVSQHQKQLLIISSSSAQVMNASPITSQISSRNSSPVSYVSSRNSSPVSSQSPSRNSPSDPAKPMWRPW